MAATPRQRSGAASDSGRASGMERTAWYFLRVSGIALVFLAGGHILVTHYVNVPSETT